MKHRLRADHCGLDLLEQTIVRLTNIRDPYYSWSDAHLLMN